MQIENSADSQSRAQLESILIIQNETASDMNAMLAMELVKVIKVINRAVPYAHVAAYSLPN